MGRAVEMCSGLGVCRKKLEGTMCPSYMATARRETFDARPGQYAAAGNGGAASVRPASAITIVHDVLDLCLECRGVQGRMSGRPWDVARFKSEFPRGLLGGGTARRSGRARSGHIHALSRWGKPARAALEPSRRKSVPRPMDQRTVARHRSAADARHHLRARHVSPLDSRAEPSTIRPQPSAIQPSAVARSCRVVQ